MKREDLDNYFIKMPQLMQSGNQDEMLQVLLSLASEEVRERFKGKKLEEYSIDDEKFLSENIMEQIQQSGLYEYLLQKGLQKEYTNMVEEMLSEDSVVPVNIAEQIINNDELLGEIDNVVGLIEKTRDEQFITDCLEISNLSFEHKDVMKLLSLVKNVDCIRRCIHNPKLELSEYDLMRTIQSTENLDFIKECVEDKSLDLSYGILEELIESTGDVDFVKQCIHNENLELLSQHKAKLIEHINDKDYIEKCVYDKSLKLEPQHIQDLIIATNDRTFLEKCLKDSELNLGSNNKIKLIMSTQDPDFIKQCIQDKELGINESIGIVNLIQFTKDPEFIKQSIYDEQFSSYDRATLILSTKDVDFIKKSLIDEKITIDSSDKPRIIALLDDKEFTKQCLLDERIGLNSSDRANLIELTNDKEFAKQCLLDERIDLASSDKTNIIESINDIEFTKQCLISDTIELDAIDALELIAPLETNEKIEILNTTKRETTEISKSLRRKGYLDIQTIEENLDMVLQWENVTNVEEKAKILKELKLTNEEVLKNIDFRLLDEKYIEILGKDGINVISSFPDIQDQILILEENQLRSFLAILEESNIGENDNEWKYLATSMLDNISSYDELLKDSKNFTQEDIKKITAIMQNGNTFDLKSIEDLRNYEKIKEEKCDEWITSSSDTEKKREALLYKVFGQNTQYTQKILKRYGEDVSEIEDEDLKSYITALKEIMSIQNNDTIEKIYKEVPEIAFEDINKVAIESALSSEYGKLYNRGLLKPENLEMLEENVYDAGADFNILMTSIGAYHRNTGIKNYKDDWNRPSLKSPHVCCSYIRNDMLGTAPIRGICYGFSEMEQNSLLESNSHDVFSNATGLTSIAYRGSKYYSPDEQINKTERYNEMDYSRFQNGQKKQPDYILVFKENGKIKYLEEAKQASEDWGGMPIVVVDREKVLQSEKQKLDNLLEQYEAGDSSVAREIYYKIRNNRVSNKLFAKDIDIGKFKPRIKKQEKIQEVEKIGESKVTEEDLQQNNEQITAEERKQEVSKMKQLLHRIQSITREERE